MKSINGQIYLKLKRTKWYARKRFALELTIENGDILVLPVHQLREIMSKEDLK